MSSQINVACHGKAVAEYLCVFPLTTSMHRNSKKVAEANTLELAKVQEKKSMTESQMPLHETSTVIWCLKIQLTPHGT